MDGSAVEGWEDELERWLEPFLARLRRKAQRHWAPFYLKGLLLPGERKSVERWRRAWRRVRQHASHHASLPRRHGSSSRKPAPGNPV
jgi:SRSO17 transposase